MRKPGRLNLTLLVGMLVIGLSGGAIAQSTISPSQIKKNSIPGSKLKNGTVGGNKIAPNVIGAKHLRNNIRGILQKARMVRPPAFVSAQAQSRTISIAAGGTVGFDGSVQNQGIVPNADGNSFRVPQAGIYRVTFSAASVQVNATNDGGFRVFKDDTPTRMLTGDLTAGAPVVMDSTIIATKGQAISVVATTGLEVNVSSGPAATLVIDRLGDPPKGAGAEG